MARGKAGAGVDRAGRQRERGLRDVIVGPRDQLFAESGDFALG